MVKNCTFGPVSFMPFSTLAIAGSGVPFMLAVNEFPIAGN